MVKYSAEMWLVIDKHGVSLDVLSCSRLICHTRILGKLVQCLENGYQI